MEEKSDYQLTVEELRTGSDRSCAVVGAAFVDDSLGFVLRNGLGMDLNDRRTQRVFGAQGPLGSLMARVLLAHAMDLFGNRTRHNLGQMLAIRNKLAHSNRHRSFDDPDVAVLVDSFKQDFPPSIVARRQRFERVVFNFVHDFEMVALGIDDDRSDLD